MARIRTVKPSVFKHEDLFDAERETGLPLRLAFIGLWPQCDREGRFFWRPRPLKTDIMPYDDIDFSRVLDALMTRGFIRKYTVDGIDYGYIPSWRKHQVVNNREAASEIPEPPKNNSLAYASITRQSRVDDLAGDGQVEGKGREGDREGEKEESEPNGSGDFPISVEPKPVQPKPVLQPPEGHGSDEDRFWALVPAAAKVGIVRSVMGSLAQELDGKFDQGLGIMADAMKAREPRSYLAKIIRNLKAENHPTLPVHDPNVPEWVSSLRAQGYRVDRDGKYWRSEGALFNDQEEQVGN